MKKDKKEFQAAEILCVGTELLLGEIVNTNAAYLSRGLAELGIPLYHQTVVGDNADRLACALRDALSRADLIVMTGGLGPTCDDLTKETVAEAFGLPLVFHAESFHRIEKLLGKSACALTENQKKQAMVPEGAEIFENDYGTAPGIAVEDGQTGAVAVLLPGPPGEMAPMFENQVRPFLLARSGKRLVSHNLHLIGIGEARAEEILRTLMLSSENPTVAPYAKDGEVRLRVTAMAETVESCEALCGKKIEEIRRSEVGPFIYGTDCGSLQAAVVDALKTAGKTVATAESCTGGYLSKRLTDIPGASSVFAGSVVAYENRVKEVLLGVKAETLKSFGAVSPEVASEMAEGIRERLGVDFGIGITGIAGPAADSAGAAEKPVGLVYIACASASGTEVRKLMLPPGRRSPEDGREHVRYLTTNHALVLLLEALHGDRISDVLPN